MTKSKSMTTGDKYWGSAVGLLKPHPERGWVGGCREVLLFGVNTLDQGH